MRPLPGRRRPTLCPVLGFLLPARAPGFVVIQELVTVIDEQVRRGVLDADADDGFGVLAKLADQGREIRNRR